MKKLHEITKRQRALTEKALAGTITPAEREELTRIGKAVEEATAPAPASRVVPMNMTLADFRKHAEAVLSAEAPSADAVALLKRNLEAIKAQGKSADTDTVAVDVELADEPAAPADPLAALAARVAVLEAGGVDKSFDGRTRTGVRVAPAVTPAAAAPDPAIDLGTAAAPPVAAPPAAPAAAPVDKAFPDTGAPPTTPPAPSPPTTAAPAQAAPGTQTTGSIFQSMGLEALDTLLARYNEIRNRMSDGSITRADVDRLWEGQWPLRSIIDDSMAVLAKCDTIKAAIDGVLPALRKAAEVTPEAPPAPAAAPTPPAPAPEGEQVAKSMDVADLSPPTQDPKAQFARLRKAGGR
ncbi:MAG: hypothetical protein M0R37_14665 [Bacteroidales bacterium]|jgi:hypothetical protein|nr:hypothetical protein [Bacteroidales bacterium]